MRLNIEPRYFPCDMDLASRMVIAGQRRGLPVERLANAVMRAIWAEDRDVADEGVLVDVSNEAGFDGADLLELARSEEVQHEYQGNTERALSAGVFGSPFYVFAGEKFWGQDRLDMLEEAVVRNLRVDLGRGP